MEPSQNPWWFRSQKFWLGVLVVIVLIMGCGITLAVLTDTEDPDDTQPVVTATTALTATARPTSTPTPRPTPVPPTVTLVPMPTVECPTAQEALYFAELADILDAMGSASLELGPLFVQASDNPLLFFDDDWIAAIAIQLALLQIGSDTVVGLDAPDSVSSVHNIALLMAELVAIATDKYAEGIDNLDPDAILEANDYMNRATTHTANLGPAMEGFC